MASISKNTVDKSKSQNGNNDAKDKSGLLSSSESTYNSFPITLHYMLNEVERDGYAHVISWQSHGRAFVIHNPKELTRILLPCWFRQSKYASFQRQLNLYGFRRLTVGQDKGVGYYQEQFVRGRPDLCHNIHRNKKKGTRGRKASSLPKIEPIFYLSPHVQNYTNSASTEATTTTTYCNINGIFPGDNDHKFKNAFPITIENRIKTSSNQCHAVIANYEFPASLPMYSGRIEERRSHGTTSFNNYSRLFGDEFLFQNLDPMATATPNDGANKNIAIYESILATFKQCASTRSLGLRQP